MTMARLKTPAAAAEWLREHVSGTLRSDHRMLQAGDAFIAWPGQTQDARAYARAALAAGAAACLVEHEGCETYAFDDARIASLPGLKAVAGDVAAAFFAHPSRELDLVAVTGTNGKTSTTWWLAQALAALGTRCGVIGTLGAGEPARIRAGESLHETGLTTPDAISVQAALRSFHDAGVSACAIEASSIGLVEQRLAGSQFAVAMFTNFTQDHLDFHGTLDAYWQAKRSLFDWPGLRAAVVNVDDERGRQLAAELTQRGLKVWTYALRAPATLSARSLRQEADSLYFVLQEGQTSLPLRLPLIGEFNVANALGVIGCLRALGHGLTDCARALASVSDVPGRMQRVSDASGPLVLVDYAHTPDALDKALAALRPLATQRGGRLLCVFGCGGGRDKGKRALMAEVAERAADLVVLTSDNPRMEDPQAIIDEAALGFAVPARATLIVDRRQAIARAIAAADEDDVVLIAGKGHEAYQEIQGQRLPFSDTVEARAALHLRHAPVLSAPLMTLAQAAALLPQATLVGDGEVAFARVHSDSRTLMPRDLFVALRGERFDGHDHLLAAKGAGAVAALAEHGLAEAGLNGLLVADSLVALQQLAQGWRTSKTLPLIAVTGSNGKTTVTQMLAAILRAAHGDAALATRGNFNNHIGVPLTLLRLRQDDAVWHRCAVLELGMNHPGEIAQLAELARPTVVLINNAQREHLEFMQTVHAVAQENGSAIASLPSDGVVVIPALDAHAPLWREMAGTRRVITFAPTGEATADVSGQANWNVDHWVLDLTTPSGVATVVLRMAGRHNVHNALAATAAALAAGVALGAVRQGLQAFEPVAGRSQLRQVRVAGREVQLVDDSYNANPDSVRAAIALLADLPAPRWLVLGDMGEVGERGASLHTEVGALARECGIETFWCAGALSTHAALAFGADARHFADTRALCAALGDAPAAASVLVKGSRFMKMEQVVQHLRAREIDHVA